MQTSEKTTNNTFRISTHPLVVAGLLLGALALAACQPIRDPAVIAAEQTAVASGTAVEATPAAEETPEAPAITGVAPAEATISTRSLRVRSEPTEDSEVVANVSAGDTFSVTGISSNGEWIQISIEESPSGLGWVSAGFVTLAGDITNIEVVGVEAAEATATEEVTEEATVEATEEATPEATEEPTAEATPEATEEATPEATVTEEATEEPTVEATDVVTEEVTVEATPVVTAEATIEATPALTVEATVEATPVVTAEATIEATTTVTVEATTTPTAELGTVTIIVDLPLRVRSEPTDEVENKIGSVYNLEVYNVLEVSEDELWVKIETPQFPEGSGWISAEFVVFNEAE